MISTSVYLDDDQVTCMWSSTGKEYSGRISITCTGMKCVPWARSIHKLRDILKILIQTDEGILDKFPDRSLSEASNYCRNPTHDPCGPWCYTSLVDDSKEQCCVPECSSANKGMFTLITVTHSFTSHKAWYIILIR